MDLSHILFLDIETVPQYASLEKSPEEYRTLWEEKAAHLKRTEDDDPVSLYGRAGIYAEFGAIVCISVGFITDKGSGRMLRVKSFASKDEASLLQSFADLLNQYFSGANHQLCGHNAKEFDFPYIARRMIINEVKIPSILNLAGKKPWEVNHLDTMQMWKFGDFKSYTSLKLLAHTFGLPTPKDDIDGSQVGSVFWEEDNLERIVKYCEKDVVTLVQVYLKMIQEPILNADEIQMGV